MASAEHTPVDEFKDELQRYGFESKFESLAQAIRSSLLTDGQPLIEMDNQDASVLRQLGVGWSTLSAKGRRIGLELIDIDLHANTETIQKALESAPPRILALFLRAFERKPGVCSLRFHQESGDFDKLHRVNSLLQLVEHRELHTKAMALGQDLERHNLVVMRVALPYATSKWTAQFIYFPAALAEIIEKFVVDRDIDLKEADQLFKEYSLLSLDTALSLDEFDLAGLPRETLDRYLKYAVERKIVTKLVDRGPAFLILEESNYKAAVIKPAFERLVDELLSNKTQEEEEKTKEREKTKEEEITEEGEEEIFPELADNLLLGDEVSLEELRTLAGRRGLTEDERRDRLASIRDFHYPLSAVTTHTAIFGATGSGKSFTTKRLVSELVGHNVPVLILDWHDEYVDLIKQLGGTVAVPPTATVKPERGDIAFTWNVLDPKFYAEEITRDVKEDYAGVVVDLLSHRELMNLTEPMKGALTDALSLAYRDSKTPTFADIITLLDKINVPKTTADALARRLGRFTRGTLGSMFSRETSFDPPALFSGPVCIRVKHLTADHRSAIGLLMYFILRQIESHFKREDKGKAGGSSQVRHVFIIEEVPMAMGSNPRVKAEVVRMLQELRGFGAGLVLVCRNPAIGEDILRETNQKITHMLDVPRDRAVVATTLGLAEPELIGKLAPGLVFARIARNPTVPVRITPI